MYARLWLWLVLAAGCFPAFAATPTFAELLAKAETQYDAGHRWSPPGDNMVETVASMMDIISTATPQQLTELSALLEKGAAPVPDVATAERAAPAIRDAAPAPNVATAEPAAPASPDAAPAPTKATVDPAASPSRRTTPGPAVVPAEPPAPAPRGTSPTPGTATSEPASRGVAPAPGMATAEPAAPPSQKTVVPAAVPPTPLPKPSPQEAARAADLLARGKAAEELGNVSGARRFYASSAVLGNAAAALSLGRLYDPMFLKQNALGGIDPDPALARHWYQRAAALGDPEAGRFLEALSGR